ncbi:MAG: porin family protein [Bacteroidota bacterium]
MKKLFLLTIAAFVVTIAGAQIQFGVKGGLNLANLHMSPKSTDGSLSTKTDFNAGVLVSVPLAGKFSLQPEVMYSAQGAKASGGGDNGTYNLGYINVPVLLKYNHPSGFFAEAGPQIGFVSTAKAKGGGETEDIKDQVKSTDFSAVLGIGYLSSLNIGIDARYNMGFANIIKETSESTLKNGVFQVGVFYLFGHRVKK